jgi:hypothetical protein
VVSSATFGIRDRRDNQPLAGQDRFRVRGPIDLITLMACQQQHDAGRVQLVKLLQDGATLAPPPARIAENSASDDGRPRVVPVGSRGPETRSLGANAPRRPDADEDHRGSTDGGFGPCHLDDSMPTTVDGFLRLAVEMSSNTGFATYCETQVLQPLRVTRTSFAAPDSSEGAVVTGHSLLGSPMQLPAKRREARSGTILYSTASDLAELVTQTMRPPADGSRDHGDEETTTAGDASVMFIELMAALQRQGGGTLGLALDVRHTPFGTRVEVADVSMGSGCLMRWYPQTRSGIVVLFNSATGMQAAQRLAHLALGGE